MWKNGLKIREAECQGKERDLAKKMSGSPQSYLFCLMLFALMSDAGCIPVSVDLNLNIS